MKVLVPILGLITATLLSGVAAVTVRIRAYSTTGELDTTRDPFTLGTRVLLTCNVTGLPEGSEVVNYRWYHNCPVRPNSRCEIRDGDPYYRAVKDSLLVDITSLDQGGRYYCTVQHQQETEMAVTRELAVADSPAPFLYTPTSLLPEHSVLTDVQQATGRNGQQWITCRSGGDGTRPEIWMGSEEVVLSTNTANSATIGLHTNRPNGLYHCLSEQSQREYFSLFLTNTVTLPTPTISARDTSVWTLTSADGSQVERYIVEFECRVRNITFIEKYMSVSASGGTGQVATSVSCFGGLGQLYRVKVWAVSGPNISRALVCAADGQCKEEEGSTQASSSIPLPTSPSGSTAMPSAAAGCPDISFTPFVVAAISAANTLLLLVSLAIFIASCAVLRRAKRSRQKHTEARNYTTTDDEVKVARVDDDSESISEYADVADLPLPGQRQYQTLQTGTLNDHQYATATRHTPH